MRTFLAATLVAVALAGHSNNLDSVMQDIREGDHGRDHSRSHSHSHSHSGSREADRDLARLPRDSKMDDRMDEVGETEESPIKNDYGKFIHGMGEDALNEYMDSMNAEEKEIHQKMLDGEYDF